MFRRLLAIGILLLASTSLVSSEPPSTLERIQAGGKLLVISRNGPTTYYQGPYGLTGFEYTLAKAFADYLGVELAIREENNLALLINAIGGPSAHLGASGLTITEERKKKVRFSEPYLEVTQQLIYHRDRPEPQSMADVIGQDIMVVANSSHSERLRELQHDFPALRWRERNDLEMIELVAMVHSGKLPYAIVDSNAFAVNRNVYPNARVAFDVSEPQQLAWAFPKQADSSLYDAAQNFFREIKADGRLAEVTEYFYGHSNKINHGGALLFAERIESRLPHWEGFLKTASQEYDIDWRLLAAMSYQESHWDSNARSHTGVRGLMMLTLKTAREMGIANRIDPEQSIRGGARYFKQLFERMPAEVRGADRTWMALAAYNVGMGHLEDARILTEQQGGDPDKWADVKKRLPLLAKRKHYRNTKFGYARGWEPVAYVQKIRHFYNILRWHNQQHQLVSAGAEEVHRPLITPGNNLLSLSL